MGYKITPYVNKVFNADILSYLNVDSEGDVVSAKTWKALWSSVLNFTQQIDTHMTELLGTDGIVTALIADHERIVEEHTVIIADYQMLKEKFDDLDKTLALAQGILGQALQNTAQVQHSINALNEGLVHYGDTPPSNAHVRLWIHKTDTTSLPASLADVEGRVPKIPIDSVGAPFSSVLAIDHSHYDNETTVPNDSAYKYIDVHDVDYSGKDVESASAYTGKIPTRGVGGNLWTGMPIDDADCTPKKYVDGGFVKKVTGDGLHYQVYAVTDNPYAMEDVMLTVDTQGNTDGQIPRRHSNGNLTTNTPFADVDCANKKYVDDAIASGGGGGIDLTDYVKNTDYATSDKGGVVKLNNLYFTLANNGALIPQTADKASVEARLYFRVLACNQVDNIVKVGITTNTETLTDEEKAAAQSWLGITDLIGDIETLLGGI